MSRVEEHGRAKLELQSAHQILPLFTIQRPPFQVSLKYHSFNAVLEPCCLVYLLFVCFRALGLPLWLCVQCLSSLPESHAGPMAACLACLQCLSHLWILNKCLLNECNEWVIQWKGNNGLNKGIEKTENRDTREIKRIKVVADGGWEVCLKIMRFQASDWKIVWAITWEREFTRTGGMGGVFKQHFLQYLLITMLFPFSFHPFLAM